MSQFIFGEFIATLQPEIKPDEIDISSQYPFSLRFNLKPNDYYIPIAPAGLSITPFVVTDSCFDNTAELLLQPNNQYIGKGNIPPLYSQLISMRLEAKIDLLVSLLKEIIYKTNCYCILVFSDGETIQTDCEKCSISDLGTRIKNLIERNQLFNVATYWIEG